MRPANFGIPFRLLMARDLDASAKLVWIYAQEDQAPGSVESRSGLARHTVIKGLRQLTLAGWLPGNTPGQEAVSLIPSELLLDKRLGIREKLLFGMLQFTGGFKPPRGQFTYPDLSALAGCSINTVKQGIKVLQMTNWLAISQKSRYAPIHFRMQNPVAARQESAVAEVSLRLQEAEFKGEALMREYLTLLIDSDEYDDNASPGFLVNPYTGEEMQFDRYYPPSVAFEYQGAQHYGPTARYANHSKVRTQIARDLIKQGICMRRGITLIALHAEDLTLETMRQKVGALLPLRSLEDDKPTIAYLERISRAYRKEASKGGLLHKQA